MPTPPRPPGHPRSMAFKNVRTFVNHRADFLMNLSKEYGDICRFPLAFFDCYFVNRPDLVKEVLMNHKDFVKTPAVRTLRLVVGEGLLLSKGEFHRRQRRLMQPAFQPSRIRTYADRMVRVAQEHSAKWEDGQERDIYDEMMELTLEVVSETLFSAGASGLADRVRRDLNIIIPLINRIADPAGALKMILPSPSNVRFLRARADLNKMVDDLIEERRRNSEDKGDLLSMLLAARDEEGDGGGMTDRQVRNEALTMYLAGHETTAIALAWAWYSLAANPEVNERFRSEVSYVLEGRTPTMEDIPNLPYTRQVVSETLRLYPPAYLWDRQPLKDWDVDGYRIPKKSYIFVSPYVMQRNPEYYPDPERFDPDRFTPENAANRPKFAYFPFGAGPRICIGEHFAWTEMVLVLATLAQKWNFEYAGDRPPVTAPLVSLRPSPGIPMRLHQTTKAPSEAQRDTGFQPATTG